MTRIRAWGPFLLCFSALVFPSPSDCVFCLSVWAPEIDSLLFLLLLFCRYEFSQDDETPSQLIINRKHTFKDRDKAVGEASACVWLMWRDGCFKVSKLARYLDALLFPFLVTLKCNYFYIEERRNLEFFNKHLTKDRYILQGQSRNRRDFTEAQLLAHLKSRQ